MTKLNDIQLILLTGAAQRENGSLLPAPASVADAGDRLKKAITSLQKRKLIEEGPATSGEATWRTEDDDRVGLFITDAARAAINVEQDQPDSEQAAVIEAPAAQSLKPERKTKSAAVIALLQRPEGVTLAEIIEATGWQPHTTRAALTGFRKRGFSIEKSTRDDVTCYRTTAEA